MRSETCALPLLNGLGKNAWLLGAISCIVFWDGVLCSSGVLDGHCSASEFRAGLSSLAAEVSRSLSAIAEEAPPSPREFGAFEVGWKLVFM